MSTITIDRATLEQALEALRGNTTNPVIDPEQAASEDRAIAACEQTLAAQPAPVQETVAWSDAKQSELNDWFLSLPPWRQAVLLEDKWMLAGAAFLAGKTTPPTTQPAVQEPVAWEDGPHLVVRSDMRDRLKYKGSWVDMGRAIPDKWGPVLYTPPSAAPEEGQP